MVGGRPQTLNAAAGGVSPESVEIEPARTVADSGQQGTETILIVVAAEAFDTQGVLAQSDPLGGQPFSQQRDEFGITVYLSLSSHGEGAADLRHETVYAGRLGDKIEGAEPGRLFPGGGGPVAAEDDGLQAGIAFADLFEHLHTAHTRHFEIEDHDIRFIIGDGPQGLFAAESGPRRHFPLLQALGESSGQALFVVNQQHLDLLLVIHLLFSSFGLDPRAVAGSVMTVVR